MKLSEFMTQATRNENAAGEVDANRMILAVDCSEDGKAEANDYAIVFCRIENLGASLSAKTTEKNYLLEGPSTIKTGTQRTFNATGQRYIGDEFQDFACSHDIVYGVGSAVQRGFVYFNVDTGVGEIGKLTIVTKKDGAAAAGNPTDVEIDLLVIGTPAPYTYAAAAKEG